MEKQQLVFRRHVLGQLHRDRWNLSRRQHLSHQCYRLMHRHRVVVCWSGRQWLVVCRLRPRRFNGIFFGELEIWWHQHKQWASRVAIWLAAMGVTGRQPPRDTIRLKIINQGSGMWAVTENQDKCKLHAEIYDIALKFNESFMCCGSMPAHGRRALFSYPFTVAEILVKLKICLLHTASSSRAFVYRYTLEWRSNAIKSSSGRQWFSVDIPMLLYRSNVTRFHEPSWL